MAEGTVILKESSRCGCFAMVCSWGVRWPSCICFDKRCVSSDTPWISPTHSQGFNWSAEFLISRRGGRQYSSKPECAMKREDLLPPNFIQSAKYRPRAELSVYVDLLLADSSQYLAETPYVMCDRCS